MTLLKDEADHAVAHEGPLIRSCSVTSIPEKNTFPASACQTAKDVHQRALARKPLVPVIATNHAPPSGSRPRAHVHDLEAPVR